MRKDEPARNRTIKLLDYEVPEEQLKASLREVLGRRGLRADLVLEDTAPLEQMAPDYADYANIYKYAFF